MTAENAGEKPAIDDVFSKGSDMGADTAAPDAPEAPEPVPQAEAQKTDEPAAPDTPDPDPSLQGRDPSTGRFVPVKELVAERKRLQSERDAEAKLRAEAEANAKVYREQVERYERQLQAQQQPRPQQQEAPKPPDFYADPDGWAQHQQQRMQAIAVDQHVNTSERFARMKHGDQAVDTAIQAARQAGIASQFIPTRDPFEALMAWHRKVKVEQEIGGDFEAYKKRIEEEAVQKALANLKQTGSAAPRAPQRFPGTIADNAAAGTDAGALSEKEAADSVFIGGRRKA